MDAECVLVFAEFVFVSDTGLVVKTKKKQPKKKKENLV